MRRASADVPGLLPILSRGKHRSPRQGACFMEMVSYFAGERWTDHPRCTHPLVAVVARLVNDHMSDRDRPSLAPLIPSVIGLTTSDARADAAIALRCATTALPIVSADRQKRMAVSVLGAERALATLEGREPGDLRPASIDALESAPQAASWASSFVRHLHASVEEFRRFGAPHIAGVAVPAIAEACVPDPDQRLHDLLVAVIGDCALVCGGGDMSSEATGAHQRSGAGCS